MTAALAGFVLLVVPGPAVAWEGANFSGGNVFTNWGPKAALVKIHCPGGTTYSGRPGDYSFCTGRIWLFHRGRSIGSAPVALRTNDRITQQVPLAKSFEIYLRHRRHVGGILFKITTHDGQGNYATHQITGSLTDTFRHER